MDINNLVSECTAYDYKSMLEEKKPKSWLKSISAFANGQGGSLFFGIDDNGEIIGLDDVQHVSQVISTRIRDLMDPLPDVELIPLAVEGKEILQVKVSSGHYTPYYLYRRRTTSGVHSCRRREPSCYCRTNGKAGSERIEQNI